MLTYREDEVFQRLAVGHKPAQIAAELGIQMSNFYVICSAIRRKTRIRKLTHEACKHFQRFGSMTEMPAEKRKAPKPLTPRQVTAMRLIADLVTYEDAAKRMGICSQSVQNAVHQGCKRAGIIEVRGLLRISEIRQHLATLDVQPVPSLMDDPMF